MTQFLTDTEVTEGNISTVVVWTQFPETKFGVIIFTTQIPRMCVYPRKNPSFMKPVTLLTHSKCNVHNTQLPWATNSSLFQSGVCESALPVAIMSAVGHQECGGSSKQKT